ncbi:receptor-type tyrosine-protein phosphatase mu-like [Liolophura sinensis]|uniref:receptor-type tyrosine-protein phosphatase mu-like n=1 Tax=Liolophura sinensis TaxID=3198878 RepID=UPI003158D4A4
MPGHSGLKCKTECANGFWGGDCALECGNCYNGSVCNKTSGECPVTLGNSSCAPGYVYTDITCLTPCESGSWGDNCSQQCNQGCGTPCNITNGLCQRGCPDGFVDDNCKAVPISNMMVGRVAGGVTGVLVACAVVVAVIIIYRRRHPSTSKAQAHVSLSVRTMGDIQPDVEDQQSNREYEAEDPEVHVAPEDPEATTYENHLSTSVPVEEFWDYIQEKMAADGFKAEFMKFPAGLHAKAEVANLPYNKAKSRYKNLVAYDHSRVVLRLHGPNDKSDYINACYIDGYNQPKKFIASQGPTDLIINDFMRMLWEQNVGKIVMVTNLIEATKMKCKQYWPGEGCSRFGVIEVTLLDEEIYANYAIRTLELSHTKVKNKTKILKQFHFSAWPDHGAPSDATILLDFRDKVLEYNSTLPGPILVHCSAGIGRTGTFIALDYLINQAKEENVVNVPACVMILRQQRVNMVQTQEQYEFLHAALGEALEFSDSSIPSVNFTTVYSDLCTVDPETGQSKMVAQFEVLRELSQPANKMQVESARHPDNISKNRYSKFLALDSCRPYLSTPVSDCNDYINAVYLPGYKQKRGFILTQTPLPNTVVDFWRLVYDHKVSTIIMLDRVKTGDKNVGVYWTDRKETFKPFEMEVTDVVQRAEFSTWTYELSHKDKKAPQPIKQFRCPFFTSEPTLETIPTLLTVLQSVDMWRDKAGDGPVLVHCRDGVTKSGLFCVVWTVLERLKVDQNVNILQTIKQMRNNRPEIITDVGQLNFIHQVVMGYLDNFQTYANFRPMTTDLEAM